MHIESTMQPDGIFVTLFVGGLILLFFWMLQGCKKRIALIIVDPQNDFCTGGALVVPNGEEVIPVINRLREAVQPALVVLTQDWHPANHVSFASNHRLAQPFTLKRLRNGTDQMMWPAHCTQGSFGAQFHAGLIQHPGDLIVQKGCNPEVDSYSGFGSEDGVQEVTPLLAHLRTHGITDVVIVGLAYDYCVSYTAKDAAKHGFQVTVVRSATRGISAESCASETAQMTTLGVRIVEEWS